MNVSRILAADLGAQSTVFFTMVGSMVLIEVSDQSFCRLAYATFSKHIIFEASLVIYPIPSDLCGLWVQQEINYHPGGTLPGNHSGHTVD
jgi:hypothetical protein